MVLHTANNPVLSLTISALVKSRKVVRARARRSPKEYFGGAKRSLGSSVEPATSAYGLRLEKRRYSLRYNCRLSASAFRNVINRDGYTVWLADFAPNEIEPV